MIQITTKIIIEGKSPEQIFDWLRSLNKERYIKWHPIAHKDYGIIRGTDDFVGSVIYFEEILNGFKISGKWKIVDLKTDNLILMKAETFCPIYLSLSLSSINKDTELIHELRIGFVFHGLEKNFDWFVRKFIFTKKKIEVIGRHATEEFKNFKYAEH